MAAELITELRVDTSSKCAVQKQIGITIGTMVQNNMVPHLLLVSIASGIKQLNFGDGQIKFLSGAFPVTINNSFCLKCVKFDPNTAVLANCSVKAGKTYPAGALVAGVGASSGPFITVVSGFIDVG